MIDLCDASLRFTPDDWVLRNVAITVRRGEFVTVLGPSGCGKSSLLRLIAGLTQPTAGEVLIDERVPTAYRRLRDSISLVFQEPRLLPWRNVRRNIALPLELSRVAVVEQETLVRASLNLIGLRPEDATKYPRMLSGGMRMRVALARAGYKTGGIASRRTLCSVGRNTSPANERRVAAHLG